MKNTFIDTDPTTRLPKIGDEVSGKVIQIGHSVIYLDLKEQGAGIIYGKEFLNSKESLKKLEIGDTIHAKIIDFKNKDGYMELSVSDVQKKELWKDLKEKQKNNESFVIKVLSANKGGLLTKISGVPAFLPVSQLSSKNYPRITDGEATKILQKLQSFIGKDFKIRVLDIDEGEEKIILSEKIQEEEKTEEFLEKNYKLGEIVKGTISGTAKFGAFIKFQKEGVNEVEGLIHISELDWRLLSNPTDVVKIGDKIDAKIINITKSKVFLSRKALQPSPWEDITKKYKVGSQIKGTVTKFNPYGAFVQLTEQTQGLIHISQFKNIDEMQDVLEIGKEYNFEITLFEPKKMKINLKIIK